METRATVYESGILLPPAVSFWMETEHDIICYLDIKFRVSEWDESVPE